MSQNPTENPEPADEKPEPHTGTAGGALNLAQPDADH